MLEAWLRDHNEITYKSRTYTFGQADIREAIRKLTIQRKKVRDWTTNLDVQNEMRRAIDEYLYDALKERHDIPLTGGDLDVILDGLIDVAKHRDAL